MPTAMYDTIHQINAIQLQPSTRYKSVNIRFKIHCVSRKKNNGSPLTKKNPVQGNMGANVLIINNIKVVHN